MCHFDDFENEVNNNPIYQSSYAGIIAIMENLSKHRLTLKTKFRYLGDKKHKGIYEFKKDKIRVYVYMPTDNVFIILGGFKNNQPKDIKKLQRLIKGIGEMEIK